MKIQLTLVLSITMFIIGIVGYAYQNQYILLRLSPPLSVSKQSKIKKKVTLYYWHNNRWNTETQEWIWSSNVIENIAILVTHWLTFLDTEEIIPKKVLLQSVALSPNLQDAYLSFDRNILPKKWSIQQKWLLIEGLLQTIRKNNIPIDSIRLLVHHQPLSDVHLNFAFSWPITGFLSPNCNIEQTS